MAGGEPQPDAPDHRLATNDGEAHGGATAGGRGRVTVGGVTDQTAGRPGERVGVLVVRVWTEPSQPGSVRMRVTRTLDVASPLSEVSATADVEEVCETLRQWLREFRARAGPGPQGG